MLAVPDEYGRGQHRHEQAAAEREANGEAGDGVPCSGMRRREHWRAGRPPARWFVILGEPV